MCAEAAAVGPAEDLWMRCRDGTRLASRIWRPEGEGPWPVLLMRQPYGRAIASTVTYAHPRWYASQGFLVVVQDVRGRGDSEGDFGGFAQEAADGADAVRWTRQLPGSNGRLGTYGFSYQGLSQLLNDGEAGGGADGDANSTGTSSTPPADPLPDALAPAMCGLDERLHWASSGGAHWWVLGLSWGLQLAAEGCRRRGDTEAWQKIRRCLEDGRATRDGLALLRRHDPAGMVRRWLEADPAAPATAPTDWAVHEAPLALLRRPMLLIGGWWDPHLEGLLDLQQRSLQAGGRPILQIGPWTHLQWQGGVDRLQLAFFRQHLQRSDNEPATAQLESQLFDTGTGQWLRLDTAPASTAVAGPWTLASSGLAAVDSGEGRLLPITTTNTDPPSALSSTITVVHDPWRPVPGRGGHLGLDAGLCDRSDLDARFDVACFTSAPLAQELILQGRPQLDLTVAADQESFDLCGALSLVEPSGAVHQLSTAVRRQPAGSIQQPRPCRLTFQPLRHTLQTGQRLRLALAGAAWPQIAVNSGRGDQPHGGPGPEHRVISLTLLLNGSCLQLEPLLSARLA